jgi:hypothetical protein
MYNEFDYIERHLIEYAEDPNVQWEAQEAFDHYMEMAGQPENQQHAIEAVTEAFYSLV